MFTRQAIARSWKETRPYVIFSALLFFAGIIAGGAPNSSVDWLSGQLQAIQDLADRAREADNPQLEFFWLILVNNLSKSVMAMYLGVVAGVLPLIMLVLNGMIIGFLFGGLADQGQNVWLLAAKGILPHGILELPALFLACGFGIRLGFTLIKGIFGSMLGKTEAWGAFVRTASGSVPALLLIALMLLIAAGIESTVTYWLVSP
ncbi:stage II sporulation protein M [Cohnella sp. CFH 77786]|uniref:stage II sporulation protein M n=1 Tax=Cohnella sp. CFH 77786 TaxID=2662265 RepID=UPI001C60C5CA|nr:stage II sporulation protein M [Cohnella sp. CFH 77786]MBW5449138.1 stage II sporulation protein M [Cohnella sp. CFH 77786]